MVITPADLHREPLEIDTTLAAGVVDYNPDVLQTGPLSACTAAPSSSWSTAATRRSSRTSASARTTPVTSRCSAPAASIPVPEKLAGDFDLLFRPADADPDSGERAISEEETEIGYYDESGLVLEDVVREQVLLSLPNRTLCTPDCKGLCQHCGTNLNTDTCSCDRGPSDPRWSALAGLANRLPS